MILVRVYWDGYYQGEFHSPVRLTRNDTINGNLFKNIVSGEKFRILTASPIDIYLSEKDSKDKYSPEMQQDIHVTRLE